MTKLTNQTALNSAAEGLMAQGRQSADADGLCRYRGPDNLRCGIGFLIPDNLYTPWIEGVAGDLLAGNDGSHSCNWMRVPQDVKDTFKAHFSACNRRLLDAIQSAHDNAPDSELNLDQDAWRQSVASSLARIAEHFALQTPPAILPYLTDNPA